jgi:hypothetical protein
MYAYITFTSGKAIMIFRFSDNDKAIEVMRSNGVNLLDAERFGILETNNG